MRPTPVTRHDSGDVARFETLEQIANQVRREERHIARSNEDEPVPRGSETGLHAGERSQAAATFVGDPAYLSEPRGFPTTSHHDDLRASSRKRVTDAVEQRHPTHLQEKLVAAHPAALSPGENHPRRLGPETQGVVCGAAPALRFEIFCRSARMRSSRAGVERRARRLARARSTAAACILRTLSQVNRWPEKASFR